MKLSVLVIAMLALAAPISGIPQSVAPEPQLRAAVTGFLQTWLVEKDSAAAFRYFNVQAIASSRAIDFPCANGADEYTESRTRKEAGSRARSFLRNLASTTSGKSLRDILFLESADHPDRSRVLSDELSPLVVNIPQEARYYLFSYARAPRKPPLPPTVSEVSASRSAFVCVVQFRVLNEDPAYGDDATVFLVWMPVKGQWKLVSLAGVCE